MALNFKTLSAVKVSRFFTVKKLTWLFALIAVTGTASAIYHFSRMQQIDAFNQAISEGKPPRSDLQSFEAKFATAYWLAKNERYKEATLLFNKALNGATTEQKAAIHYNLGNIFFLRGLIINGTSARVRRRLRLSR